MTVKPIEHGTRRGYQRGCNCDGCRQANADYKARRQADNKARTEAATKAYKKAGFGDSLPSLAHGKPSTYYWQGCRCRDCKEGVRVLQANYRRRRFVYRLAEQLTLTTGKETA